jgi:putative aldouronate transport system permease protein
LGGVEFMRYYKKTTSDWIIDGVIYFFLLALAVLALYPFLNAFAISANDAQDTVRGGITILPRKFTMENYRRIFSDNMVYNAYIVTIARTVLGTLLSLFFTGMFAYALAKPYLVGRALYTKICIVTMYFSGGLIPSYFLIKYLGLINNFWVYIIPGLISVWNMILMRTFFAGLPESLEESAKIDGAGQFRVFFQIIIPISTPIIATIALFNAVGHWNSWFDATMYVTKQDLKPMQTVLMRIIDTAKFTEAMSNTNSGAAAAAGYIAKANKISVRSVTMATMIVTVLPIILSYPFLQKYFVKGIMVGSIKG